MNANEQHAPFFEPLIKNPADFTQHFKSSGFVPDSARAEAAKQDALATAYVMGNAPLEEKVKDYIHSYDTVDPFTGITLLVGLTAHLELDDRKLESIPHICEEYIKATDDPDPDLLEGFDLDPELGEATEPDKILTTVCRVDGMSHHWFDDYLACMFQHPLWWKEIDIDQSYSPTRLNWQLKQAITKDIVTRLELAKRLAEIWCSSKHPDNLTIKYLLDRTKAKGVQDTWLDQIQLNKSSQPPINIRRGKVLKKWMEANGFNVGDQIQGYCRADVWEELNKLDSLLFKVPARDGGPKGGSLSSTPKKFFQWAVKEKICSFLL